MKLPSLKLLVIGIAGLLLAACAAPATPTVTPTSGPPDVVQALQTSYNAHDADGVIALFGDPPQYNHGVDTPAAVDVRTLRNLLEFQFAFNSQMEFSDCATNDSTVVCQLATTDDCTPTAYAALDFEARFVMSEGKITIFISQLSSDQAEYARTYQENMLGWARDSNPADYDLLNPSRVPVSEWSKFSNADVAGSLTASEFGQLYDRTCKAYLATNP